MAARIRFLLDPRGTIDRGRYALLGIVLALVKVNLDRAAAGAHGEYWSPLDYWSPTGLALTETPARDRSFLLALAAIAIPFVWAGVALTLRRLRDAGAPRWLVVLFFVPFVNLVLFLVLCVAPAAREHASDGNRLARLVARDRTGSAAQAVLVSAVLTFALLLLGTEWLASYGWGLFVGIPFTMGLVAALLHGYHEPRGLRACVGVALASVALASLVLLGLAIEGAICLVMAAPLVGVLAAAGGVVGYLLQRRAGTPAGGLCSLAVLVLPLLLGVEARTEARPAVLPVTTAIVVDAPPAAVWPHVVSFAELPPPRELVFRLGIAYPTQAAIEGRGVGAVRRCRFSTGDFVEPITVWDAPRLLAFDVRSQPPPLRELSPWGAVRPPHLDGFLRSRRGEFRLTPLRGGRTLLVGTTWYENRMWPARYWRVWSDALIHRIHRRVLEHVAASAAAPQEPESD